MRRQSEKDFLRRRRGERKGGKARKREEDEGKRGGLRRLSD